MVVLPVICVSEKNVTAFSTITWKCVWLWLFFCTLSSQTMQEWVWDLIGRFSINIVSQNLISTLRVFMTLYVKLTFHLSGNCC